LLLLGLGSYGIHIARKANRKERNDESIKWLLGPVAEQLDSSTFHPDYQLVEGEIRGLTTTCQLLIRDEGDEPWTEIDVSVATGALSLDLRPQTKHDEKLHHEGLLVDGLLFDRAFDEYFVVEAAPLDVVRILLDEDIRNRLLLLYPLQLTTIDSGLRLAKRGWSEDEDETAEMINLLATIAVGIEAAFEHANRAVEPPAETAYRGDHRGAERRRQKARKKLARKRKKELEKVAHLKEVRRSIAARKKLVFLGVCAFIIIAVLLLAGLVSWT